MRSRIVNFIGTLIPVMLGVYLAVAAQNCSEQNRIEEQILLIKNAMVVEIESNRNHLTQALSYHETLKSASDSISGGIDDMMKFMDEDPRKVMSIWRGTRMTPLTRGSYEAAISTGIMTELNSEELITISHLYSEMENYDRMGANYLSLASSLDTQKNALDYLIFLNAFTIDAVNAEKSLINSMDKALKLLGE